MKIEDFLNIDIKEMIELTTIKHQMMEFIEQQEKMKKSYDIFTKSIYILKNKKFKTVEELNDFNKKLNILLEEK